MRVMAYIATVVFLVGLWGMFLLWRKKFDTSRFFLWVATWTVITPFLMATAGWLLTESGRQPWIVQGLMLTKDGLSGSGQRHPGGDQPGHRAGAVHDDRRHRRDPDAPARPPRPTATTCRIRRRTSPSDQPAPSLTY